MAGRRLGVLFCYRKLLKLYPPGYRHEYEEEMLYTMQAMLADAPTPLAQWKLLARACRDYVVSLTQQNILAFEGMAPATPRYVKQSSLLGTSLVLPFFLICGYNCFNLYVLRRAVPFLQIETRTWVIYCILLPVLSFLIVVAAGTRNLGERLLHRRNTAGRSMAYDWLLLGVPLGLLALILAL